jgi:hypothetical protein
MSRQTDDIKDRFQSAYAAVNQAAELTDKMAGNGYDLIQVKELLKLCRIANGAAQELERLMAGCPAPVLGE